MAKRSSRGSNASHRRRVAAISQQELSATAPFAQVNPLTLPEVKAWLRVDQATAGATFTLPDALGGPSATETSAPQQPVLGTTGNGLAKLTTNSASRLVYPVNAAVNDANWFGMALWLKPSSITANLSDDIFTIATTTGASANRLSFRQSTMRLVNIAYTSGSNNRLMQTNTTRAYFAVGVWKFVGVEFDGSQALEANRHRLRDMGAPVAQPMDEVYSSTPDEATVPTTPSTLPVVTGTGWLFQRQVAFNRGFSGDVGPDIFFYDPRTMTQQKLVQLAQYRVPTG